jgi:two-component system sensor histidine kinase AtoS
MPLEKWKIHLVVFMVVFALLLSVWGLEHLYLKHMSIGFYHRYELVKDILYTFVVMAIAVSAIMWHRQRSEQVIYQRERYLANIVNNSADAIISCDSAGNIHSWNKGAEGIFGYTQDEIVGRHFSSLFESTPWQDTVLKKINEIVSERGYLKNYEIEMVSKDRHKVWANLSYAMLRDLNGNAIGTSIIIKDGTERKLFEERMQQSEKLIAVGQLAAGVAHEVFTPLNVISGNAEYLLMGLDKNDGRVRELQAIIGETERITKLVQRLMDFARPHKLEFAEMDINKALVNVLDFVKPQLMKAKITVETCLDEKLPLVMADDIQMEQSFLNIVINSWQAMAGGGTLTISTSVWHTSASAGEQVQIKIADTGTGIDQDNIHRIFDPFFTTKDIGKGAGLGLTISYRIVEDHGGSIKVDSTVNVGTTVTVTLPVKRAA